MEFVVLIAGLLVISGVGALIEVRMRRKKAEVELQAFAATVPAPLTPGVRRWLEPQLARRSLYPVLGAGAGLTAANIPLTSDWFTLPWYWFAAAVGSGAGTAAGILLAGYRTVPLVDGPQRTVDPAQRRISDYLDRSRLLQMRLSLVVSATAFALSIGVAATVGVAPAARALLACGLGVALVVAHHRVVATIVARPMVTSSPEGLVWQKALVAKTIEHMPRSAVLIAGLSAAIALLTLVTAGMASL